MSKQPTQLMNDDLLHALDELKAVAPEACKRQDFIQGLLSVVNEHLRPLSNDQAQSDRIVRLVSQYAKALEKRVPDRRPRTKVGTMRSLGAFVTKDLRTIAKEYADFEARAEKTITANPAMHLTQRGLTNHEQRALNLIDRFMLTVAQQWENLSSFRTRIQGLENQFYDRDDWSLHLHDRIGRLTNFMGAIDAALTSLKRAIINKRPFNKALESLRALRDNSLNPLEFVDKVFAGYDGHGTVEVALPPARLNYSNHFLVREVLLELTHNALANDARHVRIGLRAVEASHACIAIEDDCPGGLPQNIQQSLGTKRIEVCRIIDEGSLYDQPAIERGWGLHTVINNLVPRLGEGATIKFISPLTPQGGTRVTLTVPIIRKNLSAENERRRLIARTASRNLPMCTFRSADTFATSGCALSGTSFRTSLMLPLHTKREIN